MAIVGISFNKLCWPAYIYLVLSAITLLMIALHNYFLGNINIYCIGNFSCNISPFVMFAIKIIYVLFWTWILNLICRGGGEIVSWFLVVIPYLLFLSAILLYVATSD
jgi:hypothetical protein